MAVKQDYKGVCFSQYRDNRGSAIVYGPIWFGFFLTSFSENPAVGRIWL
jgi:hypothetical protein